LRHALSIGVLFVGSSLCEGLSDGGIDLLWGFGGVVSVKLGYSAVVSSYRSALVEE
jgi:hypothetical protein